MSENQYAPCPFCGGTELMVFKSDVFSGVEAWIFCRARRCRAQGPERTATTEVEAIAAAWEAWDAAGKMVAQTMEGK